MGWLNDKTSLAASVLRGGRGWFAKAPRPHLPAEPLVLFEYEACPYCRKVRETLCELDLDYLCRPTAHGSKNRAEVIARGGQKMFPFLVDANTGTELYESEDIIDYLHATYGTARPWPLRLAAPLNTLFSFTASAIRPRGRRVRAGITRTDDLEPLLLYNYEASPYCRKVREVLAELDLDYTARNLPKKGARRQELRARGGRMMVPYLVDPNTGEEMYESDDIVAYLVGRYG